MGDIVKTKESKDQYATIHVCGMNDNVPQLVVVPSHRAHIFLGESCMNDNVPQLVVVRYKAKNVQLMATHLETYKKFCKANNRAPTSLGFTEMLIAKKFKFEYVDIGQVSVD